MLQIVEFVALGSNRLSTSEVAEQMKLTYLTLTIVTFLSSTLLAAGHTHVGQTYHTDELPYRGRVYKPPTNGSLFFYFPRAYEVYHDDGNVLFEPYNEKDHGYKFKSAKRSRNFPSTGVFISKDGKEWELAGRGLHFTSVWTHPRTSQYFATLSGSRYNTSKNGRLHLFGTCNIVTSEDGKDWRLIQGDLDINRPAPSFMTDPASESRVCLFYGGQTVTGDDWTVARPKDDAYSKWVFFDRATWKHEDPRLRVPQGVGGYGGYGQEDLKRSKNTNPQP